MQNGVQQALATLAKLPCCNLAIGAQMFFFQDAMKKCMNKVKNNELEHVRSEPLRNWHLGWTTKVLPQLDPTGALELLQRLQSARWALGRRFQKFPNQHRSVEQTAVTRICVVQDSNPCLPLCASHKPLLTLWCLGSGIGSLGPM